MNINPKFLYDKEGNKEQVLLTYQDFMKLIEKIENLEDIIAITDAQREGEKEGFLINYITALKRQPRIDEYGRSSICQVQ